MRTRTLIIRVALCLLVAVAIAATLMVFVLRGASVALPFVSFVVGALVSPAITVLGEWVRDKVFRPHIRALRTLSTVQGGVIVTRLLVKNDGSVRAREVEAVVEAIFDAGQLRENFIGMPLRWTHGQVRPGVPSMRDIHVNQECLLDVAQVEQSIYLAVLDTRYEPQSSTRLRLCSEAGGDDDSLSRLPPGQSKIAVAIYDASGGVLRVQMQFSWDGQFAPPAVAIAS